MCSDLTNLLAQSYKENIMHLKHLPKDFVVLVYAHDKNLWTGHKIDAVKAY